MRIPSCKMCRRLGASLCGREKCAFKRKPYPPGIHGKSFRRGASEYGLQLREKQKVKFLYGLGERQFRNYVASAGHQNKVATGEALVVFLETRLDNIIFKLGFAPTRRAARQMATHGHILVNDKRVNIPSYRAGIGDEIKIRPESAQKGMFTNLPSALKKYNPPEWLILNKENFSGKILSAPPTQELIKAYNLSSIVEFYSR